MCRSAGLGLSAGLAEGVISRHGVTRLELAQKLTSTKPDIGQCGSRGGRWPWVGCQMVRVVMQVLATQFAISWQSNFELRTEIFPLEISPGFLLFCSGAKR